ncbi:MAG: single-stranded DNA-binding protein [Microbacterium sp.]|nr:single-stranded DNA-binding protein [Microbacterium sp.]
MTDQITVLGTIATEPRHLVTGEGLAIVSFRLASPQRRSSPGDDQMAEACSNWYTITGYRRLAVNAAASLRKGDRVIVTGRLRLREWTAGGASGTTVEIEADTLGPDLGWAKADVTRTTAAADVAA